MRNHRMKMGKSDRPAGLTGPVAGGAAAISASQNIRPRLGVF
jgi:hypothetical protein